VRHLILHVFDDLAVKLDQFAASQRRSDDRDVDVCIVFVPGAPVAKIRFPRQTRIHQQMQVRYTVVTDGRIFSLPVCKGLRR